MNTLTAMKTYGTRNQETEMSFPATRAERPISDGIAQVREARALGFVGGTTPEPFRYLGWTVKQGPGLLSAAQAKFVIDIAERSDGVTEAMLASLRVRLEQGFAKQAATQFISSYKDLPRKAAPAPAPVAEESKPTVADGRYAVEHEGTLKFFKVKNGRKAGFIFLSVQASDEWHPIRNLGKLIEILRLIAADELTAARRYGQEIGSCSRCGRTLTNEESRAYGIGPECRKK